MFTKKLLTIIICLLFSSVLFASQQKVILFFESANDISTKTLNQINSSDKLCISAILKDTNKISEELNNLIIINKIEPTASIAEPYFPLISKKIEINKDLYFDKTSTLDDILSKYKGNVSLFEKRKVGLSIPNNFIDENFLQYLYKKNILWVLSKTQNDLDTKLFVKNNVAVFIPYTNLPNATTSIDSWLSSIQDEYIPIFVSTSKIRNEKYISYLLNFIDKNKKYDVYLPINAAYEIAKKENSQDINLVENIIPNEILVKLAVANNEVENNKKNEQLHSVTLDELENMYSAKTIDSILKDNSISKQLFNISYENIFKISNKQVPDISKILKETKSIEQNNKLDKLVFTKLQNGYTISNENIIKTFTISKTTQYLTFYINYNQELVDDICIYIDMNKLTNIGNQNLLKNLGFVVNENCWEYAILVSNKTLKIYKYVNNSNSLVKEIEIEDPTNFSIPISIFRGNPYNWNYQVVATKDNKIVDFIETSQEKKENILNGDSIIVLPMIDIK